MIKYYKVGGCVRDKLMGFPSKDVDFAVEAPSFVDMRKDLIVRGIKIFQERPEFLTIRGNHPEFGGVDYVLCRRDGFYSDGRHPDKVEIGTIIDDLARRDFTCNAIAESEDGTLFDPFNGREDIKSNTLSCVGSAADRLSEDALRIMRAIRFHVVKGFEFDEELIDALHTQSIVERLANIKVERIRDELLRCFRANTCYTLAVLERLAMVQVVIFQNHKGLWLEPTLKDK